MRHTIIRGSDSDAAESFEEEYLDEFDEYEMKFDQNDNEIEYKRIQLILLLKAMPCDSILVEKGAKIKLSKGSGRIDGVEA